MCSRKLSRDKNGIIFVSISSIRYVSEECQMLSDHGCLFDMGALWWVPLGKVPFGGFLWERSFLEKSFMEVLPRWFLDKLFIFLYLIIVCNYKREEGERERGIGSHLKFQWDRNRSCNFPSILHHDSLVFFLSKAVLCRLLYFTAIGWSSISDGI